MKKQIILLALTAAFVLFFSCNKNKENQDNQWSNPAAFEEYRAPAAGTVESNAGKQGYALRVNTGFYIINGEDKGDSTTTTKWDSGLTLGDSVTLGNPRKLTYDKKEWDFVEVRLNNKKQGFAIANQISVGGRLAVVIEEKANLFSEPTVAKATNTVVARKTVLVYFPETESGGFVEIKGVDYETKYLISGYMRLASFSRNDSDIQASILLQTAEVMTSDKQTIAKTAILKAAVEDYPDSVFNSEIRKILNPSESSFDDD
jgi:hypothetical protein